MRSIIFLGAPHKGLNTSALETLVLSKPTEDMVKELKAESPTLTELSDKFRFVAENIDIVTCYEMKKTRTAMKVILKTTVYHHLLTGYTTDAGRFLATRRARGYDGFARLRETVVSP